MTKDYFLALLLSNLHLLCANPRKGYCLQTDSYGEVKRKASSEKVCQFRVDDSRNIVESAFAKARLRRYTAKRFKKVVNAILWRN